MPQINLATLREQPRRLSDGSMMPEPREAPRRDGRGPRLWLLPLAILLVVMVWYAVFR